ncbi:MAG: hypothetical protein NT092_14120 [Bacteroidia bacterium]|nr:hypothetical protein [Bacteroidia bacterium]
MIELDKKLNPQNSGTELDEELLNSLPLPVYDAYRLLETETDFEKSLQVLCLSLIPWTYQYIALILSGEYLESKHEPSFEVTDCLLNMVKKPGPGKWIGFARIASDYFMEHAPRAISPETIKVLNAVLNEKSRPLVKVPDNENRLEYTDALISVRNRFAHSRSFTGDKAKELFQDYFLIWKALVIIIKGIFTPRLLYRSIPHDPFHSFDNRSLETQSLPSDTENANTILWHEASGSFIRLYPIIVTSSEDSKSNADVAFLEEIRNKYLFYLQGDNFFKLKDEFEILSKLIEAKTLKEEVVTAGSLTLKIFSERIDRITNQTISDYRDALKYIPEIYLDRPTVSKHLDTWLESDLPGCVISGKTGTGKTSLITNWCVQRKAKGDHILLFEASKLSDSDITGIIEKELNLGSPLKDCLDNIQKQNISLRGDEKPKKFIIVIDAVNEFTGTGNENRSRLWREINSLIIILNLYNPYLKCLVTTRSDLWSVDFPEKNSASDMLKEKLYWGDTEESFPKIMLGNLSVGEARDIYEKAKSSFPSMAVQNSFDQLSEKTKEVLCNPFFLRLALVTYNGKEIPNLTRSKIERQYAKARITEEKDKKTVLFALLERMSQLRKTELTIDDLLYAETKSRFKRKMADKEKKELEKLIYDPRPQSSYKKLIREGIIEETSEESTIKSKEKIRFSQEKILNIIQSEFRKRDLKMKIRLGIIFGIYLLIFYAVFYISDVASSKTYNAKVKTELNENIHNTVISDEIYLITTEMIGSAFHSILKRYALFFLLIFIPFFILIIMVWYLRSYGARITKYDLPSRFIKEKFTEMKAKKIWYGVFPFLLIIIFLYVLWLKKPENSNLTLNEAFRPFLFGTPILIFYFAVWDVLLGSIIVFRRANSPQDAFCIFGKKEVIQTCFEVLASIPFFILVYFSGPIVTNILNINDDKNLISARQEWISNEAVNSMKDQNPEIYSKINDKFLHITDKNLLRMYGNWWDTFSKVIVYSVLGLVLVYVLLQYFTGFLLYKLLKRKL